MQRDASKITLSRGAHQSPSHGLCLLEAAAWIAGEDHGDHPDCVDPVIASFGRSLNDTIGYGVPDLLPQLAPLAIEIIGTRTNNKDSAIRAYMARDWAVRGVAAKTLRVIGERRDNSRMLALAYDIATAPEIVGPADISRAMVMLMAVSGMAEEVGCVRADFLAMRDHARRALDLDSWAYSISKDANVNAGSYAAATAHAAIYCYGGGVNFNAGAKRAAWEKLLPSAIDLIRRMCAVGCVRNENAA